MPDINKVREKSCIICSSIFTACCQKTLNKRQFCSHKCQAIQKHNDWEQRMKSLNKKCEECGETMFVKGIEVMKQKRFCSHSCCAKFGLRNGITGIIQKGDHHTNETREKFRKIGKQRDMTKMCSQEVVSKWLHKRGQTMPERTLGEWLQEAGLHYNFVGDGKLCIGGYWPDFINADGHNIIVELSEHTRNESKMAVFTALGYITVFIPRQQVSYGMKENVINKVKHSEEIYHSIHGKYTVNEISTEVLPQ